MVTSCLGLTDKSACKKKKKTRAGLSTFGTILI